MNLKEELMTEATVCKTKQFPKEVDWNTLIKYVTKRTYDIHKNDVDKSEVRSAACLGVWMAALKYNKDVNNIELLNKYIVIKGTYLTIDILRSGNNIHRKTTKNPINLITNLNEIPIGPNIIDFFDTFCESNQFDYEKFYIEWSDELEDDKEREIFRLRHIEGQDHKYIAKKFGVNRETSVRWSRAIEIKLQATLLASVTNSVL